MRLSIGTTVTRVISAVGQVLLALWLSPSEFGYWAAASSLVSVVSGLMNFGEVNGYLSRPDAALRRVRQSTRRMNSALALAAVPIALCYLFLDRPMVALLALLIAVSIPLQGEADVLYAAYVKNHRRGKLVRAQALAAVGKTVIGITFAVLTGSALALGVSFVALPVIMIASLWRSASAWMIGAQEEEPVPRKTRFAWAVNSLSQTGPTQAGYLVTQFVASPAVLGVYYLAYQVTAGISGLVSVPLARTMLSTLSASDVSTRRQITARMAFYFTGLTACVASVIGVGVTVASAHVDGRWQSALPTTVLLLAGLPIRMLSPLMDAYQQSASRWWQSTYFNLIDTLGTAAAAVTALTGDVKLLALATTVWKGAFGLARMSIVMRDFEAAVRVRLGTMLIARTTTLVAGGVSSGLVSITCFAGAAALAVAGGLGERRTSYDDPSSRLGTTPSAGGQGKVDA